MNIYDFKKAVASSTGLILDSPPLVGVYDGDGFGTSVALNANGDICAVGSPWYDSDNKGQVTVYKYNKNIKLWEQLGNAITGENNEQIGYSISMTLNGQRLIIGSKVPNTSTGSIYVYDYINFQWVRTSTITGQNVGYWSGFSVSINNTGDVIAFGSPKDDTSDTDKGSVVIYKQIYGVWIEIGTLYGELVGDNSGWSVSLNGQGNIIAIGAPFNDSSATDTGHTKIFQYVSGTTWTQLGSDIDGTPNSQAGFSVALNYIGNIVAIGNVTDDSYAENGGTVKVYKFNSDSNQWELQGNIIIGQTGDQNGWSISCNDVGDIIAVGSPYRDAGSKSDIGAVQLYRFNGSTWGRLYPRITGTQINENSGWSVSLSKNLNKIVIGAPNYIKNGNKVGIARIYTLPTLFQFWEFNYTSTTSLTNFSVQTSTPSDIVINWGDFTRSTVASGALTNHTYTI